MARPDFCLNGNRPHNENVQEVLHAMRRCVSEAKREALVAEKALTFIESFARCGRFRVPLHPLTPVFDHGDAAKPNDIACIDVEPVRPREVDYDRWLLNAVADAWSWAERTTR